MTVQIAVFAGEPSGDRQAGALLAAMAREWEATGKPPLRFWGIGGPSLREAGVELAYDSSDWGAMGVAEALKLAPRLLWVLGRIRTRLRRERPALVLLVDFGGFNVRVAAAAKELGLRVFYYFPPGSWKRNRSNAGDLPRYVDRVVTPFPWSEEILRAAGVDAHFVGHPLVDLSRTTRDRATFCAETGLDANRPIIAYLPGSRKHEIRDIWPAMAGAAARLSERDPGLQHVVLAAPGIDAAELRIADCGLRIGGGGRLLQSAIRNPQSAIRIVPYSPDAIAATDLVITKAGSVTLEAALHRRPMIVVYRVSWLQELEYRLWHQRRIRFIAMPNILADRPIAPELIQREANPERIAALGWELLTEAGRREEQIRQLEEVASMLGPPGAVRRAARLALEMLAPVEERASSSVSSCAGGPPSSASRRSS